MTSVTNSETTAKEARPKIRARLFNLIVYSPNLAKQECLKETIQSICARFPCRIIIIQLDPQLSGDTVEATTRIVLAKNSKDAQPSEETLIKCAPGGIHKVPYVVMPNLIPDIPIHLMWGQNPCEDKTILPHFHAFATRLIFDTDKLPDWQTFASGMVNLLQQGKLDVIDINWAMLASWRDIFVRVFSTEPDIDELRFARRIRISFNPQNNSSVQGIVQGVYLVYWLAAQLEWTTTSFKCTQENAQLFFSHEHGELIIDIDKVTDAMPSDDIIKSIEIVSSNGSDYAFHANPTLRTALIKVEHTNFCEMPYHLPLTTVKKSFAFIKELLHRTASIHYRNMLEKVVGK